MKTVLRNLLCGRGLHIERVTYRAAFDPWTLFECRICGAKEWRDGQA